MEYTDGTQQLLIIRTNFCRTPLAVRGGSRRSGHALQGGASRRLRQEVSHVAGGLLSPGQFEVLFQRVHVLELCTEHEALAVFVHAIEGDFLAAGFLAGVLDDGLCGSSTSFCRSAVQRSATIS